ncbi:MAG: hypothetical protein RL701_1285 [Pseudomonadota bacterium]
MSVALRAAGVDEVIVHSGQHYDHQLSQVFFDELGLPAIARNLGVGSGPHGQQTGLMLAGFERAIAEYRPDIVLVHGDTNSTLAAALAAAKLGVKLAHNEAGVRSFNRSMPEEHNRVLTDHCADLLFCTSEPARQQLAAEGIQHGVHVVGDVMYDAALSFVERASRVSTIIEQLQLTKGNFVVATLHRPHNVDEETRLRTFFRAFAKSPWPVVIPAHPRLQARMHAFVISPPAQVRMIEPVGYLDMLMLERHARMLLTDSGGAQKEAYFFGVPCLTLRAETEWTETVATGWNRIVDADEQLMVSELLCPKVPNERPELFGDGHAAEKIVAILQRA